MGGNKLNLEEIEFKRESALELCIKIGAIKECDDHPGEYFEDEHYPSEEEVTAAICEEIPDGLAYFENMEEMTRNVKEVLNSTGSECALCQDAKSS